MAALDTTTTHCFSWIKFLRLGAIERWNLNMELFTRVHAAVYAFVKVESFSPVTLNLNVKRMFAPCA